MSESTNNPVTFQAEYRALTVEDAQSMALSEVKIMIISALVNLNKQREGALSELADIDGLYLFENATDLLYRCVYEINFLNRALRNLEDSSNQGKTWELLTSYRDEHMEQLLDNKFRPTQSSPMGHATKSMQAASVSQLYKFLTRLVSVYSKSYTTHQPQA